MRRIFCIAIITSALLIYCTSLFAENKLKTGSKQSDSPVENLSKQKMEDEINALPEFKEGEKLIETFYEYLLSDCDVSECPDLFTGCLSAYERYKNKKKELLAQEWKYLRDNIKLFFPLGCDNNIPEDASEFYKSPSTYRGYFFFNPPDINHISKARLKYIVLINLRVRKGVKDRTFKYIFFPISKDEMTKKYKIDYLFININGAFIGSEYSGKERKESEYFDRDYNLFKWLGFNLDREVPDKEKEEFKEYRKECEGKEGGKQNGS